MDPVTQAVVGASFANFFANRKNIKLATVCGILGGLAPDLDVLICSANDPLLSLEYHRHFTHSLFFIPIGGFLVAIFVWLLFFRKQKFSLVYLYTTLGWATHGLIDALTNYGTSLYWPFSNIRVSWNTISIVDPVFTILLLLSTISYLFHKCYRILFAVNIFAILYIILGFVQHSRVEQITYDLARSRDHKVDRVLVAPSLANLVLWRSVYLSEGKYYVNAIRLLPFSDDYRLIKGTTVRYIDKKEALQDLAEGTSLYNDIERFFHFTQGYIYSIDKYPNYLFDLRYSILPNSTTPMWGIEVDYSAPSKHVSFSRMQHIDIDDNYYDIFFEMLGDSANSRQE